MQDSAVARLRMIEGLDHNNEIEEVLFMTPQFSVNPTRSNPYKQFKFRIKWDGRYGTSAGARALKSP